MIAMDMGGNADANARKRRIMEDLNNDNDKSVRSAKRKRLSRAMGELNLGSPASAPPEWGAPFGTRTRLRSTSPRRIQPKPGRSPLEFGGSFKRALETFETDNYAEADVGVYKQAPPAKRRRDNTSKAMVLYRNPSTPLSSMPLHLVTDSTTAPLWTSLPRSVPKVVIEPDDVAVVVDITEGGADNGHDDFDMEVDAVVYAGDDGERYGDWNREKALVTLPSAAEQRRADYMRAAAATAAAQPKPGNTQTAILMPWHDRREVDGDVVME